MLGDADRKVSKLYDMIHPEANDTLTVRIGLHHRPEQEAQAIITYPASTGRNFQEILRVIDSLQLTDQALGGDASGLEAGRGLRDRSLAHRPQGVEGKISQGLARAEAVFADDLAAAAQISVASQE